LKWFQGGCLFALFLAFESVPAPAATGLEPISFAAIPGWTGDDHTAAFAAFRRSCSDIGGSEQVSGRDIAYGGRRSDWVAVCEAADGADDPRIFFEKNFSAFVVHDADRPEGLFTGYYEPQVEGSRKKSKRFSVPIYARPPDLIAFDKEQQAQSGLAYGRMSNGKPAPYFTRREIEQGALDGKGLELVWIEDWADAFFIHIQGSGRVHLDDGSVTRLSFSAKSGLPYTGIGSLLVERGAYSRDEMSMQTTRDWLRRNPQDARKLMWENQSFIFFREMDLADPALGALGAQHVQLTPQRSLAVDRSKWMLGTPVWLDTSAKRGDSGPREPFRRLMIAQDTGSAIRGLARGDVYWGFGEEAGLYAGPMKSPGRMIVLLPHAVTQRLDLGK
jgi:membrane-bound lytic murein transglycosylase A